MKPRHQVSRAAVDLIKRFEGYRQKAAQLPDGRWTIGYGHTLTARGGATVSEQDAEALLLYDLITVAHAVNENSYAPLNQNQFDALTCFAFNIGTENFLRSGVLRRINEGSLLQAACAMEMWRKADFEGERIVIDALVRRRAAEKTLFLTPPDGQWVPAPSPVLRPKVDYDATCAIPRQTPAAVSTRLEGDKAVAEREEGVAAPLTPVEPEEDAPTATEVAAAGVSARLEKILADEPAAKPVAKPVEDLVVPEPPPAAPVIAPVAASEPAPVLHAPVEAAPTLEPFRLTPEEPILAQAPLFTPDPPVAPAAPQAPVEPTLFETAREPSRSPFNLGGFSTSGAEVDLQTLDVPLTPPERPVFGGSSLLVSLGLLGLALFGGGVLWNLSVASDPGLTPVRMFGWGASVIGVICFAVSAYLLLRKLGGPDIDDDGE
ncbi:lysozyme-family localization factor SpmX [Caulobacter hibisci]|uniref:Lysozyme n=1 Tax=Caulobacter hibisci TaxID=2035993 RepID=A0ABS0SUV4_9CAUL|nr:lysozyme [Caulobacter hibisci]MBI1682453.1 glycoside hydrolase family protein [Caulobacter hibisci]